MGNDVHVVFLDLVTNGKSTEDLLDLTRDILLTNNHGKTIMSLWMEVGSVLEDAKNEETARVGNTLKLFATGTWREYVGHEDKYIHLDEALQRRLKCLTIVSLCEHATYVEYAAIQKEIDVDCVHTLESLVIHGCVYAGLLCGTLDQKLQRLHIHSAVPRDVWPESLDGMIASLDVWLDQAHKVASFLEEQTYTISRAVEKSAIRASYHEQELEEASRKVSMEKAKKMAAESEDAGLPRKERDGSRLKKTRRQ